MDRCPKVIAVDFGGTLCDTETHEIGEAHEEVIQWVKMRKALGDKIILWTCRTGEKLTGAILWCEKRGLRFDAVNENIPEKIEEYGADCRKVYADIYVDNKCLPWNTIMKEIANEQEKLDERFAAVIDILQNN